MAHLEYYKEERERYAEVPREKPTMQEITRAVPKLAKHFKVPPIAVESTSGNRYNHYNVNARRLRFNVDHLDWLTVAHEFAHYLDWKTRKPGATHLWHGKRHAKLVDRVFRYIQKCDWEVGAIGKRLKAKAERKEAREVEREERIQSTSHKIQRREAQIERLARRIKTLETRMKTAKRSLAALRRAETRKSTLAACSLEVPDENARPNVAGVPGVSP